MTKKWLFHDFPFSSLIAATGSETLVLIARNWDCIEQLQQTFKIKKKKKKVPQCYKTDKKLGSSDAHHVGNLGFIEKEKRKRKRK